MKTSAKFAALFAATCLALASSVRAQLVTASTINYVAGSAITFNTGQSRGETFTNILAINSITYTFLTNSSSSSVGGDLTATFGEWSSNAFVGGTTVSLGTVHIDAPNTWGSMVINGNATPAFNVTLNLDFTQYGSNMNPSTTYAIMFTNSGAATSFGLALTDAETYGDVFSPNGIGNLGNAGNGVAAPSIYSGGGVSDWGFAALVYVPNGSVVPVPESSTIAALAGALLVFALAGFRIQQRRKEGALVPVTLA